MRFSSLAVSAVVAISAVTGVSGIAHAPTPGAAAAHAAPNILGQDGQIFNNSPGGLGVIKSFSLPGNYQAVVPAGHWSSGPPTNIGDVDGFYIGPKYRANRYTCEITTCNAWRYIGQYGPGKWAIGSGLVRDRIDYWYTG